MKMSKKYLEMVYGNKESGFEPIELKEDDFDKDGNLLDDVLLNINVNHWKLDDEWWDEDDDTTGVAKDDDKGTYSVWCQKTQVYRGTFKVIERE
jgi:hypothetical protein